MEPNWLRIVLENFTRGESSRSVNAGASVVACASRLRPSPVASLLRGLKSASFGLKTVGKYMPVAKCFADRPIGSYRGVFNQDLTDAMQCGHHPRSIYLTCFLLCSGADATAGVQG